MRQIDEINRIDDIAGELFSLGDSLKAACDNQMKQALIEHIIDTALLLSDIYNEFCVLESIA